MLEVAADLLQTLGFDLDKTAIYPDFFAAPMYMPAREDTTPSRRAMREGSAAAGSAPQGPGLKQQAEVFVMVDNQHRLDTHGRAEVSRLHPKPYTLHPTP